VELKFFTEAVLEAAPYMVCLIEGPFMMAAPDGDRRRPLSIGRHCHGYTLEIFGSPEGTTHQGS
jgi:hypothetical protein